MMPEITLRIGVFAVTLISQNVIKLTVLPLCFGYLFIEGRF